MRGSRITKH